MTTQIDFSEVLSLKSLKVLGYTTDFNQCDCCGRENLKGTVSILDMRYDVVLHYGTGCAASANKYDTLDTVKHVKKEINKAVESYKEKVKSANIRAWGLLKNLVGQTAGKVNCSEDCFNEVANIILDYSLSGGNKIILFEGQPIPSQFRQDLDSAGLVYRIAIPKL